jgi:AcrR family transcriptional regulator
MGTADGSAVPKQVDHDERRRLIAEAVFAVIGRRGLEHVSLRDVASQAGVSMGSVQHYFTSRDEMLLFTLDHMRARVTARLRARLAELPDPTRRASIRAAAQVLLPVDEPGRQEACVNVAFFSIATVTPAYAALLREGIAGLLAVSRGRLREAAAAGELADGIDPDLEGEALFHLTQGLIGPVLIGVLDADAALAVLDHQLNRIFR